MSIAVVDNGLSSCAVPTILLNDRGPLRWLTFPDDGGAIPIIITVTRTDGYASPNGPDTNANSDIVSQSGCGKRGKGGDY